MITLKTLLVSLAIVGTLSQNLFSTQPQTFNLQATNGRVIKMSSDESNMIIGFQNGTFITINRNGTFNYYTTGRTFAIEQIDSFSNLIMLRDSASNIYVFNTITNTGNNVQMNATVVNVAWRQLGNSTTYVFCVNFGINAIEYQFNGTAFIQQGNVYSPLLNTAFSSIIYSGDSNWLVAGISSSVQNNQVVFFSTSSGTLSNKTIITSAPIGWFSLINNNQNIVALTKSYQMIWLTTNGFTYANLTTISLTSAFTGCPSNLIVAGSTLPQLSVFLQNGVSFQSLNYPQAPVISVSCSQNYLASLDYSGNVAVTSYTDISVTKLVAWVIAVIAVGAVLFIVGIGLLIWCCCRRRRAALEVNLNTTGKELMVTDNVTYKQQMY